jgi:flavin reductase (DIM6/NTAB) family NADH-FMN oxidoreductase RutF
VDSSPFHIENVNPFIAPVGARDVARRLRGRLPAPVSVWTAGGPTERAGLTISSMLVVEGEPARILGLVNPLSDLWDRIEESRAFLVHVLAQGHRVLADVFAGIRPAPGGQFRDLPCEETSWGPAITSVGTRAGCALVEAREMGYGLLVEGRIEEVVVDESAEPLVWARGRYRRLG